ncbi:K88 fimbrial protein AC precursor [Erwinia sp. Ejp617]|nr:K88 fimbrial protein AC [Erwinia sp. Ejp617]ADP11032.1 K88 fimbrial protein AC precursor [Erwinia sp. Ejp617]
MKRTTITLALAATVASSSAMAWTANGAGGRILLSGEISPSNKLTPWEVKVGDALTGLDAEIQQGQKEVKIAVGKAIPILGIRTKESSAFAGQPGISPQIDFGKAVDLDGFKAGVTTLTLPIKGTDDAVLGSLTAPFSAVGVYSSKGKVGLGFVYPMYANKGGQGFFGGLAKSSQFQDHPSDAETKALALWPDIAMHFNWQRGFFSRDEPGSFERPLTTYSGYYASGIESGKEIKIALKSPIQADAPLKWNASLQVTVSYI